jgi:hypothetical protein
MRAPKYPLMPATLQGLAGRPITGTTIADVVRAQKDALLYSDSRVPLTGQYYDKFRATQQVRTRAPAEFTNAQVRGINNKAGGVKSFAAATYSYPSGQMVIGAALAGMDVSTQTRLARSRLAGLGAATFDDSNIDTSRISAGVLGFGADEEDGAVCGKDSGKGGCVQVKVNRVRKALAAAGKDPNNDAAVLYFGAMRWGTIDSLTKAVQQYWDLFLKGERAPDSNYADLLGEAKKIAEKADKVISDPTVQKGISTVSQYTGSGVSPMGTYRPLPGARSISTTAAQVSESVRRAALPPERSSGMGIGTVAIGAAVLVGGFFAYKAFAK